MPPNSVIGRGQRQPAAEFERAELQRAGSRGSNAAIGRAVTSILAGGSGARAAIWAACGGYAAETNGARRDARSAMEREASAPPLRERADDQCSFAASAARAPARPAACSSNSSASLSVIAPPSSSASTMVTARR